MPSFGFRTELAIFLWRSRNSWKTNCWFMAEIAPGINHQTKKTGSPSASPADPSQAPPSVALRFISLGFPAGLSIVENMANQVLLLIAGAPSHRADIQQRGQHGQTGESHTSQPVDDESNPLQVRRQERLPPNHHAGGYDQEKHAKPAPAAISRIDRHGTSYHGDVVFPSAKTSPVFRAWHAVAYEQKSFAVTLCS